MQVEPLTASSLTPQQVRRNQDKSLQNVFSEILLSVGKEGFASAEITAAEEPMSERLDQAWNQWFGTWQTGRYLDTAAPADLGRNFGDLLQRAYSEGGYADPITFMKGLTKAELKTVQTTHLLADPIRVDSLTEEGALNLLIPPAAQVDLNRDGLTQTGAGLGIRFPDSTTPPQVVDAWETATADLPFRERMMYVLQIKLPGLLARTAIDPEGAISEQPLPVNAALPGSAGEQSFLQLAQDWIDHLDYFRNQIEPSRYQRDRNFWSEFQKQLGIAGAG